MTNHYKRFSGGDVDHQFLMSRWRGCFPQDRVLADRVQADGRACVVVCNKWDLVEKKDDASYNKVRPSWVFN